VALSEWLPTDKLLTGSAALLPDTVTEPSDVTPSKKVTLPVAVPPICGVMVAVKVMVCPNTAGFALETKATVLLAWLTTCDRGAEVVPL
jgi:hypothetical protein